MNAIASAERYFEFSRLQTGWRTEIFAGLTTFVTMAYIIFVNPAILHEAGLPVAGVTAATCLAAGIGSLLMGVFARLSHRACARHGPECLFHLFAVVLGMHR